MLNFVFIFAIFSEIILTILCINKIVQLENKISIYNEKLIIAGKAIVKINENITKTVKNLNKFVRIITDKRLIKTLQIVRMTIDIVQTVILLRSLDFSKGLKSINYKNIKKILMTEIARRFIRRYILKYI